MIARPTHRRLQERPAACVIPLRVGDAEAVHDARADTVLAGNIRADEEDQLVVAISETTMRDRGRAVLAGIDAGAAEIDS